MLNGTLAAIRLGMTRIIASEAGNNIGDTVKLPDFIHRRLRVFAI